LRIPKVSITVLKVGTVTVTWWASGAEGPRAVTVRARDARPAPPPRRPAARSSQLTGKKPLNGW
jgi:hypothetical protein